MFSSFMVNAWIVGTIVAVVAGAVGFFVVARGSSFAAHALPNGSFAGAAGAALIGIDTLIGLAVCSVLGAVSIALLGRRGRHDVATALVLVLMLALGSLFLSLSSQYAPAVYSLLFGEILGIGSGELAPTAGLAAASLLGLALLYRPLLLSSVLPEVARARGIGDVAIELGFLIVVALTAAMTIPVVGTLLVFTVMIGAPAAARSVVSRPAHAIALSVAIALATVWGAIALSYDTNYPVGFYVGTISAGCYLLGRLAGARRGSARAPRAAATALET
ncbi:MAG TPA: metal ABC transporter permease [Solirubrobacteraceae bacterium]|jgi:zinc/manganese transport system permease protein|nr:metal ABC transporter permease [Solirubrobacteraceae bacterium]